MWDWIEEVIENALAVLLVIFGCLLLFGGFVASLLAGLVSAIMGLIVVFVVLIGSFFTSKPKDK